MWITPMKPSATLVLDSSEEENLEDGSLKRRREAEMSLAKEQKLQNLAVKTELAEKAREQDTESCFPNTCAQLPSPADLWNCAGMMSGEEEEAIPNGQEAPIVQDSARTAWNDLELESLSLLEDVMAENDKGLEHALRAVKPTKESLKEFEKVMVQQSSSKLGSQSAAPPREKTKKQQQQDKLYNDLEKAISGDRLEPRAGVGQRILNIIKADPEKLKIYKAKDRAGAEKFRLEVAQDLYDKVREERRHGETWRRIDTTRGSYFPFSKMVKEQGGDFEALVGCTKTVQKCLAMGPPWVHRHPQTERLEYCLLHFEFAEEFETSWSKWVISYQESTKKAREDKKKATQAVPIAEGSGTAPAGVKPVVRKDEETAKKEAEDLNDAELLKLCTKLKPKMSSTLAAADSVLGMIATEPSWTWADNEGNKGALLKAQGELKDKMNKFILDWLVSDLRDMKKRTPASSWRHSLDNLYRTQPLVEALDKQVSRLSKMQQVTK